MVNTIQIKKGAFASLPTLAAGELGFSTDTKQLHIGDGAANHEVITVDTYAATSFLYATSDNIPENKTPAQVMAILSGTAGAAFAMNGKQITGVADPTLAQDVATKAYADSIAGGIDPKNSCRVATAAALPACTPAGSGVTKTLTGDAVGILTVDGIATVLNDRILVKNQVAGLDDGIYKVTTEGTAGVAFVLTRAVDFNSDVLVTGGAYTFITEGTANADEGWILTTNDPITLETTALVFSQFSSATFVDTFLELTDTPASYTGETLKVLRVNAGETAVEFVGFATTYLDDTAGGTNAEVAKASTSNVMYDHGVATTGVHGASTNTLLHSASTIDGGAFA